MISRVLVANRGEIARRIFRTCREMGIATVAIFSDADEGEPHVREADDAIRLAGSTPRDTYLDVDAVLAAAKQSGADAIHPGYGFLAENAAFARAVVDAGMTWIGPSPEAIEVMGSKLESKIVMKEAGVPTLPGIELTDSIDLEEAASSTGYPVLVKASAGGGGKGMRIVSDPSGLAEAVDSARREAGAAFGDDTIFLERYLEAPRHIEIQVMGDASGRIVSLHERECSIQRRHQKIIEEAPSPAIDPETRSAMGRAAVRGAQAVGYVGAGTVEFLYQAGDFYFLEMNTRLQVEHPVTELVTGLDLVRLQIEVADGSDLPEGVPAIEGHAIEARLYAEDPMNGFLPVTGTFHRFEVPDEVRVDAGVAAGSVVSVHYDPMIAKVISHAPTRAAAAAVLSGALRKARIHGSITNRALLVRVLEHAEYLEGKTDTHFLQRHDPAELGAPLLDAHEERLAAVAAAIADQADERDRATVLTTIPSGWRNSPSSPQCREYEGFHGTHHVAYSLTAPSFAVEGLGETRVLEAGANEVLIEVGGAEHRFGVARYGQTRYVDSDRGPARLTIIPRFPSRDTDEDEGSLHAPMPGRIVRVETRVGATVAEGDSLVVMEAMKMEHTLRAPHDGTVSRVLCEPGDQVDADTVLVVVE